MDNFPPVKWSLIHPRLAAWLVLSLGMVILLVIEARNVGLTAGNWIALVIATVLVAGLCIWIVSWEDVDELDAESALVGKSVAVEAEASDQSESSDEETAAD
jgi:K+ transporter